MNRNEVVNYVKNLSTLSMEAPDQNLFYVSHTFDENSENDVFLISPHTVETFEVICAWIQFKFDDLRHAFEPSQEQMKEILIKFYGCSEDDGETSFAIIEELDLYENWEIYCGAFGDIEKIELLQREGLFEYLQEIINREEVA